MRFEREVDSVLVLITCMMSHQADLQNQVIISLSVLGCFFFTFSEFTNNRGAQHLPKSWESSRADSCWRSSSHTSQIFPFKYFSFLLNPFFSSTVFAHCAHHSFNQGFYPARLQLPRSVCPEVPPSGSSERGHTPGESACSAELWSAPGYHVANPQGTSRVEQM